MENILCILPGLHGGKGTQAYSEKLPRVVAGGGDLNTISGVTADKCCLPGWKGGSG